MASYTDREPPPSKASRLRRIIEGLGPYQSLVLLAIPTALVEPLKLVAVVKPKLLMLPWFARLWAWFMVIRGKAAGLFRSP